MVSAEEEVDKLRIVSGFSRSPVTSAYMFCHALRVFDKPGPATIAGPWACLSSIN